MTKTSRPRLAHGSYAAAFLAGTLGAFLVTLGGIAGRSAGVISMNPEMGLGSMITSTVGPGVWLFGLMLHLFFGGVFGLLYAVAFRTIGRSGALPGIVLSGIHYLAAGVFLGLLPRIHGLIPEQAPAPGWFALNTNPWTFFAVLVAHVFFGALVGELYYRSAKRNATRAPGEPEPKKRKLAA